MVFPNSQSEFESGTPKLGFHTQKVGAPTPIPS